MRLLPAFFALVVLAAAAGCMGGNGADETSSEPTPPSPSASPSAPEAATPPPASAPPPAPEPAPSPPAEPAPAGPPRVEIYNASFDFASQGDPSGQNPKSVETSAVRVGHTLVFVNVTLTRSSTTPTMIPVSGTVNSPAVRILDANGQEVLAVTEEGTTSGQAPAVPGPWTVRYEGAGTLRASVSLVAVA